MRLKGQSVQFRSPREALEHGVALVTEDRKDDGLILPFAVRLNLALPTLAERQRLGFVEQQRERAFAEEWIRRLSIRVQDADQRWST
ncbi:hypothetical protein GCM10025858_37680 [Alicyclobacillus sacchari]|uniref:hypothetical protein n=1 Tax=Alicyclobacillus sacchari TaxID=392010 RepID=UPI0023E99CAD|nr:hypothetical protein [Alicyclobacillus sacchari]GMA59265.1 hypothetical protein GCM10025858_37680 [Alicyclobacillus sacchari]